jgi:DNA-binding HxlR family transcriptional regulator
MSSKRTTPSRHLALPERQAYRLEDVVDSKWSTAVVAVIGRGIPRPANLERFIPGIFKKVLNERLLKLLKYGLITREEFPGKSAARGISSDPTGRSWAKSSNNPRPRRGARSTPGYEERVSR